MRGPDFLGIGAQKAGTTWLHARLSEMPQFFLPPVKELHYFDRSNEYPSPDQLSKTTLFSRLIKPSWTYKAIRSVLRQYRLGRPDLAKWYRKYYFSSYTDEWYMRLFDQDDKIQGELSPAYAILKERDIEHLHNLMPHVKLIFILRDPISRAWSHFRHAGKEGIGIDPTSASEEEILAFMESPRQVDRGDYLQTIRRYKKYFKEEQLLILFYDELLEDPTAFLSTVVDFLGGDKAEIQYCKLDRLNNVSLERSIPERVLAHLRSVYAKPIKELAKELGHLPKQWESHSTQTI